MDAVDTSSTSSPSERSRGAIASEILEDLKSRDFGELKPILLEFKNDIASQAARVLDHDMTIDEDKLLSHWKVLLDSVETQARASRLATELKTINFRLLSGDWVAAIVKTVKGAERAHKHEEWWPAEVERLKSEGLNADKAQKTTDKSNNWVSIQGRSTAEIMEDINHEKGLVSAWRANGMDPDDAPSTPILDRLVTLSPWATKNFLSMADFIKILVLYDKRNELAHHKPPLFNNHLMPDSQEEVDWAKLKTTCEEAKETTQRQFEEGILSEEGRSQMLYIIDAWLHSQFSGFDPSGQRELTPG